jgi:hypothetical protein
VKKAIGFYPCPDIDTAATTVVSHAGTRLLTETIAKVGLDRALSRGLEPWRLRLAVHDPAKVLLDLALALAVGGDCLADIALLRAEPALFGSVASDPTVRGRSTASPPTLLRCWRQSTPPAVRQEPGPGHWPQTRLPITTPTRRTRWSSTWTPPW